MRSNVTDKSVKLAAEYVGLLMIFAMFLKERVPIQKQAISCPSFYENFKLILNTLEEHKVFIHKSGR